MNGEEAKLLDVLGHSEIYSLRLYVGGQRYFLLFSAAETGKIRQEALTGAQLRCCYALSQIPALFGAAATQDRLSDRERECLVWVSEGKTTDEVGADPRRFEQHDQQLHHPCHPETVGHQPGHGDRDGHQERHHLNDAAANASSPTSSHSANTAIPSVPSRRSPSSSTRSPSRTRFAAAAGSPST